jgi:hypothetical protein
MYPLLSRNIIHINLFYCSDTLGIYTTINIGCYQKLLYAYENTDNDFKTFGRGYFAYPLQCIHVELNFYFGHNRSHVRITVLLYFFSLQIIK